MLGILTMPGVAQMAEAILKNGRASVPALPTLTPAAVAKAEAQLLKAPQADCPVRHIFADGVCIREVKMPAGALVIGHAHRFADVNILLAGRLTLLMDDGTLKEMRAPLVYVGTPGRKIAYIQEDVIWQNAWPLRVWAKDAIGDETEYMDLGTNIEAIEAHYLDKSAGWQQDQTRRMAIARLEREVDRQNFKAFLYVWKLAAAEVRRISEDPSDQCEFPAMVLRVQVGESAIEGKGLMATGNFAAGDTIAPARIGGKRTPAGRFTNHAKDPNAKMVARLDGGVDLVALRTIKGCAGGQPGEEITVDYGQVMWANLEATRALQNGKELNL